MQTDMHFYGTYVLARAAGITAGDARTIAYAAQFVDDSTHQDSTQHSDGGLLYGIATAHHDTQCILNNAVDRVEQRRVWVPFHFLPGGDGDTLEERLLCVKDSEIAQQMMRHHVDAALTSSFGLQLLGIAAHVYMDTFSHYGFSGIGSDYNDVDGDSFEMIGVADPAMERYLLDKKGTFIEKFNLRSVASFFAEQVVGKLGHASVATYPDRPFLHWRVTFSKNRLGNGTISDRDNSQTFFEGCQKLHGYFSDFARNSYADDRGRPFEEFHQTIETILKTEGKKESRIEVWREEIRANSIYDAEPGEDDYLYDHELWEEQKNGFHNLEKSETGIDTNAYRFHQAAALHRYYVLKELLPSHNIAVY